MVGDELSNKDEVELLEGLKAFGDCLEKVGIEGVASVNFSSNGNIFGCFSVSKGTHLKISLEEEGGRRRKMVEYSHV
ncbi:MAG: hypothetical protein J6A75_05425 [Lachnospiraceae bacterium]|nr:hypothetical protein [Lachnospiraceae bacterium]